MVAEIGFDLSSPGIKLLLGPKISVVAEIFHCLPSVRVFVLPWVVLVGAGLGLYLQMAPCVHSNDNPEHGKSIFVLFSADRCSMLLEPGTFKVVGSVCAPAMIVAPDDVLNAAIGATSG